MVQDAVYDVSEAVARGWIAQGLAVVVEAEPSAPAVIVTAPAVETEEEE